MENILAVEEFSGKYFINESYRPIAQALTKKYRELAHVNTKAILFVEDTESTKKKNGRIIFAQISQVPEKWNDIVYQATGRHFEFLLEIFKVNIAMMSREQIIALIYHELRHIDQEGKLRSHDIEDWTEMIEKLGVNWNNTRGSIPDLLADSVDWNSIQGPLTLFPAEVTLKVVK